MKPDKTSESRYTHLLWLRNAKETPVAATYFQQNCSENKFIDLTAFTVLQSVMCALDRKEFSLVLDTHHL